VTSSFVLRYVDQPWAEPWWRPEERGDCFKFVYDGKHLVAGHDERLAHEDLIEELEVVSRHKPDRPSLTLGWIWIKGGDAAYELPYENDRNPDLELELEKWLKHGGPDDARTDSSSPRQ
jgi:hypothetical protein